MKIKEIRLYGFKSFFEETRFLLNPGITAFVGPNGSGKSNIFDALRWVFGEQSMKALRCERNEDLIHLSPDGKNDANFTEVAIIIDNEDYFPQFGGEFEIKRRFYRTGESEFFLNRVKCRLQDIQALFLNSGALTYSFLELAEIKKIIGGNTKEMFDDVSGILKYQERRDQTQRRLEATEQDLLRLEDVIAEMVRSLRALKRQARQAQVYREIKAEYRTVSLTLMKRDYELACQQITQLENQIKNREQEKQNILLAIQSLENNRRSLKERIAQAESAKAETVSALNALDREIEELAQDLAAREEDFRQRSLTSERLQATVKEKNDFIEASRRRISEYEKTISDTAAERDRLKTQLDTEKAASQEINQKFFALQEEIQSRARAIARLNDEITAAKNEIIGIEIEVKNQQALQQRLDEEYQTSARELQHGQQSTRELDEEMERIARLHKERTIQLEQASRRLEDETANLAEVERDLAAIQESSNECRLEIETLTRRLGKPETMKQVDAVLGRKLAGVVRDSVEVKPGAEAAADACLADIYNYLIIRGFVPADLDLLPDGTIGLINSDSKAATPDRPEALQDLTGIMDQVRLKPEHAYLARYLQCYFIVADRNRALELAELYPNFGFVTPTGTLFKNGLIVHQKGDVGYFKINQSLQEHRARLETMQNQSRFLQDEKNRLANEIEQLKADLEQAREELFKINLHQSETNMRRDELARQIARANQEVVELNQDRETLTRRLEELNDRARDFGRRRDEQAAELERCQQEQNIRQDTAAGLEREIEANNQRLNEILLQTGILQERLDRLQKQHQELTSQVTAAEADLAKMQQNTVRQEIEECTRAIENLKAQLADKKAKRREMEARQPDHLLEATAREHEALYDQLTEKQKQLDEIQQAVNKINYEIFEHTHRREELIRKAQEDFDTDLASYVPEDVPDPETRRQEIREQMEKLGEINPLALEAYEQEKKRLDEFFKQRNDIITAKQSLIKSIDELDGRARERFVQTFQQVKEEFNTVFANFFEGGEADLILTDPQNPLNSQVEIVVRMANKRIKTINQLSGGEQTLLAVSLLLAFYLVKPAPFCILDEIDAPLDDANVVRFNRFLRDLSQRTQVVIITHNRATMEYADYLYGLTSERPGQSKVISVKLADLESIESMPAPAAE